jgi:hypothetical protein
MKRSEVKSAKKVPSSFPAYHVAPPDKERQLRRKILTKLASAITSRSGNARPAADERQKSEHDRKLGK